MIWLVVPAYDEALNVPILVGQLRRAVEQIEARVIVVDDGSTDRTGERILKHAGDLDLRVIRHPDNRGLGVALRTGLLAVLETAADDDAVVTLEADTTSDLRTLEPMLARFDRGADVVLASVHAPGGRMIGVARWRLLASRGVSAAFRRAAGLHELHTLTSLYRVYRAGALREALTMHRGSLITETGFAVNLELLVKLARQGARIEEVPTTNDWGSRQGTSKMRTGATARAYARLLVGQFRSA